MQEYEFFTIWIDVLKTGLYPADEAWVSISQPTKFIISLFHHFKHLALTSPVMTEQIRSSLFI